MLQASDRQAVSGQQVSYILNILCNKMLGEYLFFCIWKNLFIAVMQAKRQSLIPISFFQKVRVQWINTAAQSINTLFLSHFDSEGKMKFVIFLSWIPLCFCGGGGSWNYKEGVSIHGSK